eukprot:1045824-Amphidinium_carterae.1
MACNLGPFQVPALHVVDLSPVEVIVVASLEDSASINILKAGSRGQQREQQDQKWYSGSSYTNSTTNAVVVLHKKTKPCRGPNVFICPHRRRATSALRDA